jgi:site-specific DNA recombinase
MIAAVYARKSTDQTGVADEAKSVTRQIEHARAFAKAKGWTVADEHIYVDDGISGAEFATRPGFLRLMNALKPRPSFQALVMSEESRLGREMIETGYALKQLVQAGVRVFFYLEDRERTFDSPTDKILSSLTAFADELEREKARQRTYDALLRKARAGQVCGGRTFGYDNVRMDTGGVRRVINEAEAEVVRRIFEMAAGGSGLTTIAKTLNESRALSPRAQRGRPTGWAPSSVRDVLNRPLYRGEIVWNRTRKRDRWGAKDQQANPNQAWVRVEAPDLAIVQTSQWAAAHAQMTRQRERYGKASIAPDKAPWGVEGRYLLTGLLRCSTCGGGIEARSRSHGQHRVVFYGCSAYHRRGRSICENSLTVPMHIADDAVISALESGLLHPRVLKGAVQRAVERLCGNKKADSAAAGVRRDLAAVERELSNLAAAVAAGGDLPALLTAMRDRESQRRAILDQLNRCSARTGLDPALVLTDMRQRLQDWRNLLRDQTPKARGLLKQLIVGRLDLAPNREKGLYRFSGTGSLELLISGIMPQLAAASTTNLASPTGTDGGWKAFEGWLAA